MFVRPVPGSRSRPACVGHAGEQSKRFDRESAGLGLTPCPLPDPVARDMRSTWRSTPCHGHDLAALGRRDGQGPAEGAFAARWRGPTKTVRPDSSVRSTGPRCRPDMAGEVRLTKCQSWSVSDLYRTRSVGRIVRRRGSMDQTMRRCSSGPVDLHPTVREEVDRVAEAGAVDVRPVAILQGGLPPGLCDPGVDVRPIDRRDARSPHRVLVRHPRGSVWPLAEEVRQVADHRSHVLLLASRLVSARRRARTIGPRTRGDRPGSGASAEPVKVR